ncbi:hypothetical protein BJ742DRAFT_429967 [Cladochytrium replicatum]|nr:hypothetical protein BJ742DRAFT_429967 [Cladochytrium replicatum]
MKVFLFALGRTELERQIRQAIDDPAVSQYYSIPHCLLPVGGKPCITWLWNELVRNNLADSTYLVTDARSVGHLQRWADHAGVNRSNILIVGRAEDERQRDSCLEAMQLIAGTKLDSANGDDALFLDADLIFDYEVWKKASWSSIFANTPSPNSVAIAQTSEGELSTMLLQSSHVPMVMRLSGAATTKFTDLLLDPPVNSASSADMNQYILFVSRLSKVHPVTFLPAHIDGQIFWEWSKTDLYSYRSYWASYSPTEAPELAALKATIDQKHRSPVVKRAYARIGLVGNPSDGYFGKTISVQISDFWAEAMLIPNADPSDEAITLFNHSMSETFTYPSLSALEHIISKEGFYGASRLIKACLKVFVQHCKANNFSLVRRGFRIVYESCIPRQVGLAGSSAFITAIFKAIMTYNELTPTEIPKPIQANLILQAEKDELSIQAGLQDRVIQVYGGAVYMDFDRKLMDSRGYGEYTPIDIDLLPKDLFIAYIAHVKDSGKMHVPVRQRWENGDVEVIEAMHKFASFAESSKSALERRDYRLLASLMNQNFDLRRRLFTDVALGKPSISMIETARSFGFAAKFTGSGGCIVGLWAGERDGEDAQRCTWTQFGKMRTELQRQGSVVCLVHPK